MKILLSGGWGYGNIGDDAIMLSSIELIKSKFPKAHIVLITTSPKEAELLLEGKDDITIETSLYNGIFGYYRFSHSKSNGKFKNILKERIKAKISHWKKSNNKLAKEYVENKEIFISKYKKEIIKFKDLCKGADMYVMSGGGYQNDWVSMDITKNIEVSFAHNYGMKCYMIGQTIGKFKYDETFKIVQQTCSMMDGIFYRDIYSINDTKSMGANCLEYVVPDIALYSRYDFEKKKQMVIIPFNFDIVDNLTIFTNDVKKISDVANLKVIVCVSQLWEGALNIALKLYDKLLEDEVSTELMIPKNVIELQRILGESKLVISQNLHGLILSYRSGVPIICLNDGRKFLSFLDSIGRSGEVVTPRNMKEGEMLSMYLNMKANNIDVREDLSKKVKEAFDCTVTLLPKSVQVAK